MHYDTHTLSHQLPGYAVHLPGEVTSTQAVARDLLDALPREFVTPALIVAHHQTQGRGRGSNRWFADEGSIAVTFVLDAPGDHLPLELPLRTGLAVRQALSQWIDAKDIQIKWPNDVWVKGKKIAGILCERRHGKDLIGIGLNVNVDLPAMAENDPVVAQRATSLHVHVLEKPTSKPIEKNPIEQNSPPSRQDVLVAIAKSIAQLWDATDWCETLNEVHALTGQDIVVQTQEGDIAGVCEGIDTQGCLLLRVGERVHHLLDGTIRK